VGLARVLDLEGQPERAAGVRQEAVAAAAQSASPPILPAQPAVLKSAITVALPPALPVASTQRQATLPTLAAASAKPIAPLAVAAPVPMPIEAPAAAGVVSATQASQVDLVAPAPAPRLQLAEVVQLAANVPVAVPAVEPVSQPASAVVPVPPQQADVPVPPQPAKLLPAAFSRTSSAMPKTAPDEPAPPRNRQKADDATLVAPAVRLERISRGEVALVTTSRAQPFGKAISVAAARWVPLSDPASRPNVQVVNAARSNGIAASARSILFDRGWRKIAIGNAPTIRQASVVLYPRSRARLARSLAAQFGIRARMISGTMAVVLVIGRDKIGTIRAERQA